MILPIDHVKEQRAGIERANIDCQNGFSIYQ
jgi:hypothetical protein